VGRMRACMSDEHRIFGFVLGGTRYDIDFWIFSRGRQDGTTGKM